jgi:hypothetical protein
MGGGRGRDADILGAERVDLLTEARQLVFVLLTDFTLLCLEFKERLADDVQFVDLG